MWTLLAAKELIEGRKLLKAAKFVPLNVPVAANGWQLQGANQATMLADAAACFSRARLFRTRSK